MTHFLQTQRNIQGRFRVGSKERLTFFGQMQLNPLHSSHHEIKVGANFSHELEVNLCQLHSLFRKPFKSEKNFLTSWVFLHLCVVTCCIQRCFKWCKCTSDSVQFSLQDKRPNLWPAHCYYCYSCSSPPLLQWREMYVGPLKTALTLTMRPEGNWELSDRSAKWAQTQSAL